MEGEKEIKKGREKEREREILYHAKDWPTFLCYSYNLAAVLGQLYILNTEILETFGVTHGSIFRRSFIFIIRAIAVIAIRTCRRERYEHRYIVSVMESTVLGY